MPKKKEDKKKNIDKVIESFNEENKEQKQEFILSLEKALNFNPKKKE